MCVYLRGSGLVGSVKSPKLCCHGHSRLKSLNLLVTTQSHYYFSSSPPPKVAHAHAQLWLLEVYQGCLKCTFAPAPWGCCKCVCTKGVINVFVVYEVTVNLSVLYMYVYSEAYTYLLVLKVGKILAVEVEDKPSSPPALADSYNETTTVVVSGTDRLWKPNPQYTIEFTS